MLVLAGGPAQPYWAGLTIILKRLGGRVVEGGNVVNGAFGDDASAAFRHAVKGVSEPAIFLTAGDRPWPLLAPALRDDGERRALAFFTPAEEALARSMANGADPSSAAQTWLENIQALSAFFRRHRRRAILIDARAANGAPTDFLELCANRFGFNGPNGRVSAEPPPEPDPFYRLLARQVVAQTPAIIELQQELDASATPFGDSQRQSMVDVGALLVGYRSMEDALKTLKRERREREILAEHLREVQGRVEGYFKRATASERQAADLRKDFEAKAAALRRELNQKDKTIADLRASTSWRMTAPLRVAGRLVSALPPVRIRREIALIKSSPLFDAEWYLEKYPDVAAAGADPAKHYVRYGGREGRSPGPGFDVKCYLEANPDVAKSKTNPLAHYLLHGGKTEGRASPNAPSNGDKTHA